MLPQLIADAKLLASPNTNITNYRDLEKPCLLLEHELCSVYGVRPLACRSHVNFGDPVGCTDPHGTTKQLGSALRMCAQFTIWMDSVGLPAAMAPLQYQLLVVHHLEQSNDTERELKRFRHTPVLDAKLACCAWSHVEGERLTRQERAMLGNAAIYPIWEHFE